MCYLDISTIRNEEFSQPLNTWLSTMRSISTKFSLALPLRSSIRILCNLKTTGNSHFLIAFEETFVAAGLPIVYYTEVSVQSVRPGLLDGLKTVRKSSANGKSNGPFVLLH